MSILETDDPMRVLTTDEQLKLILVEAYLPHGAEVAVERARAAFTFIRAPAAPVDAPPEPKPAPVEAAPKPKSTPTLPPPVPSSWTLPPELETALGTARALLDEGVRLTGRALAEALEVSQPTASKRLRALVAAGRLAAVGQTTSRQYVLPGQDAAAAHSGSAPRDPAPRDEGVPRDEAEEARQVRALMDQGRTLREMAQYLGRTRDEIVDIMALQGWAGLTAGGGFCLPDSDAAVGRQERPATRRNCMTCGTPFVSAGPHHRMCAKCRGATEDPS
ncbi:winged helix-turn-helix domain-containing protein [Roseospirillum parvum]|uniref:Uncharacterized protein n=1 Tax=Roseospirillum parvum TaxID=83401 RepID=A0A1G8GI54_9PROT|nr:winged helix-turn-helix domain-containing protein [Roseospirillum parvum]SDH94074.1 hypothetical protein SAMN05421742_1284 [Roseospirillum parvum]